MYTREDFLKALGPLAAYYSEEDVTEIMVDATERILIERHMGPLEQADLRFDTPEAVTEIIDGLLALNDMHLEPGQTIVDLRFPEGEARALAVLPPTASKGPALVIRKFMRTGWITWEKLLEFGAVTPEAYEFIQKAVCVPVNILVAGGTGSGKTTMANRIIELIPAEARVIVAEQAREIQARHPRVLYLEAGGPGRVSMEELILTGAKMRPDWLIVGELVGPEAMRAMEVLGRGHSGMVTFHAEGAEDALARLEAMCLMANLGLGLGEIRAMIGAAIRLIIYQQRLPDGKRKITEIVELRGVEQGRYVLERLFRFDDEKYRLEPTGLKPVWEQ